LFTKKRHTTGVGINVLNFYVTFILQIMGLHSLDLPDIQTSLDILSATMVKACGTKGKQ
jgi:hypothetical protein